MRTQHAHAKDVAVRSPTPAPAKLSDTAGGKAVVWAGRTWWTHKLRLMPLSVAAVGIAGAGVLHSADPAVAGFVDIGAASLATGAIIGHRVWRKRNDRPLNGKQTTYIASCTAFLGLFEADAIVGNPFNAHGITVYGTATAAASIAWWLRGVAVPETAEDVRGQDHEEQPAQDDQAAPDKIWAARIGANNGALPGSALTGVSDLVDTRGISNGWSATLVLNPGNKVITLKTSDVGVQMEKVSEAFDTPPANIAIIPRSGGKLDLKMFERHPLMRLIRLPATFDSQNPWVQPVGLTITDEWVPHQLFDPDYGTWHGTFIGSTGSGKSETICTVMDAESRIVTPDGDPLVAHVLLDPHGGVSFPDWNERAEIYAEDYDEILAVLDMLNKLKKKRLEKMARYKWKVWQPSPEEPIISVKFDEFATVAQKRPALIPIAKEAVGEWRKVGQALGVGVRYPGADNFGGDMDLRDGLMGYTWLGRTGNRFSGMIVSAGRTIGDPALIPTHFADGKTTGGLGFWLGSTADASVMMRSALSDSDVLTRRRFGRAGLTTPDVVDLRQDAVRPAETGQSWAQAPEGSTLWSKIELYLSETGEEATTSQICTGIGVDPEKKAGAVSQACSRAADQGKLNKTGHGVWVLPQHAGLVGAGR